MVSLENKLFFKNNFEDISELMALYKVKDHLIKLGAEFYSSLNTKKSLGYIEKIKDLLMNKNSLKSIEKENLRMGYHFKSRSGNRIYKQFSTEILTLKKSLSTIEGLELPRPDAHKKKNTLLSFKTMTLKAKSPKLMRIKSLSVNIRLK
jgi:hypothetical protein